MTTRFLLFAIRSYIQKNRICYLSFVLAFFSFLVRVNGLIVYYFKHSQTHRNRYRNEREERRRDHRSRRNVSAAMIRTTASSWRAAEKLALRRLRPRVRLQTRKRPHEPVTWFELIPCPNKGLLFLNDL